MSLLLHDILYTIRQENTYIRMRRLRSIHNRCAFIPESFRTNPSILFVMPMTGYFIHIACNMDVQSIISYYTTEFHSVNTSYLLNLAAKNGNLQLFKVLVQYGTVPDTKTLLAAITHNKYDITEYMLRVCRVRFGEMPDYVKFLFPHIHALLCFYGATQR